MPATEDAEHGFYSGRGGDSSPVRRAAAAGAVQGYRVKKKRMCAVTSTAVQFSTRFTLLTLIINVFYCVMLGREGTEITGLLVLITLLKLGDQWCSYKRLSSKHFFLKVPGTFSFSLRSAGKRGIATK